MPSVSDNIPTDVGGDPDEKTVVRPRRKAAPVVAESVEAAPAPAPVEAAAAPAEPVAAPAAAAPPPANPYAQPAAYAQPQPYYRAPQPAKGLSVASMVLGLGGLLLSFFGVGFLVVVAAVILGHLAVKRQPYAKGFWLTGIITGYIGIAFSLVYGLIWARYLLSLIS